MRRFLLLVFVLVTVLVSFGITVKAQAAPAKGAEFQRFQSKVCRIVEQGNHAIASDVVQFNDHYYNSEDTPEDLQTAGHYAHRVYVIATVYGKRYEGVKAPGGYGASWAKFLHAERQVLSYGFKGAEALEAANEGLFLRYKTKNETWQQNRNAIWNKMGIICE